MLQSMGLQRVRHDLATEQQVRCLMYYFIGCDLLLLSLFIR